MQPSTQRVAGERAFRPAHKVRPLTLPGVRVVSLRPGTLSASLLGAVLSYSPRGSGPFCATHSRLSIGENLPHFTWAGPQ
jgi:hypothetical protein